MLYINTFGSRIFSVDNMTLDQFEWAWDKAMGTSGTGLLHLVAVEGPVLIPCRAVSNVSVDA